MLLGCSGSVAAIKLPELLVLLTQWADVRVVATAAARHFVELPGVAGALQQRQQQQQAEQLQPGEGVAPEAHRGEGEPEPPLRVLGDDDEWRAWRAVGDPVLHIELRRWADVLVVAPLSANTLAKLSCGLCDNLLTCVARAWDRRRPLVLAPAMNTHMWEAPITGRQLRQLVEEGQQQHQQPGSGKSCSSVVVVPPVSKRLACGDFGTGAMAAPADVAGYARRVLAGAPLLGE